MPEIKIKHISSFSSEDKVHKAENLLKEETYRKWKCATRGEKKASIILQFEKAMQIHSIHIGNEHSAFVEVLVGRSSDKSSDFQVLLVASSFMSPLESRNGTNANRVRLFGPEKLAQNLKDEKWDCVEIVCTQPFNKNVQYGLTFVKFHSPPVPVEELQNKASNEPDMKIGAFRLKDNAVNISMAVGSLFSKRKEKIASRPENSPAAIRQAASFAAATLATLDKSSINPVVQMRKLDADKSTSVPPTKKDMGIYHVNKEKIVYKDILKNEPEHKSSLDSKTAGQKPSHNRTVQQKSDAMQLPPRRKVDTNPQEKAKRKLPKRKLFCRIMEKVVFVISGFQNPLRREIRDRALEMGAQYKGDWDASSTHLICAFLNTPKYHQVLGRNGRIVTKDWIMDCYKKKELLPWRKYMLGKYTKASTTEEETSDSEEEKSVVKTRDSENSVVSEAKNPSKKNNSTIVSISVNKDVDETSSSINTNGVNENASAKPKQDDDSEETDADADYFAATDVDESSGGDTEDEIRKLQKRKAQNSPGSVSKKKKVAKAEKRLHTRNSDISNDSEIDKSTSPPLSKPETKNIPLLELPNFFKGRQFFLYGDFSEKERHDLERYITTYNGHVVDYMVEKVKYVVTKSKWNSEFEEALSENEDLIFVQPKWIYKCHQSGKFVPFQPYIVVPST